MKALPWGLALWVTLAGGLALAGETPEPWKSVRVVGDSDQLEGCKLIREVKGRSSWGGVVMPSYAESNVYQAIKRNAHKMGANTC